MDLSKVIFMKQSGKILPEASLFDIFFTRKMGQESITTATGNPVSIVTNKAQNAISTILSYSPKQTGTGDPSPQNIRPIEGWTEANLGVNSETPTTTISLGGTYYGFDIDVERGVLRVTTVGKIPLSSEMTFTNGYLYLDFPDSKTGYTRGDNSNVLCSIYKSQAVSTDSQIGSWSDYSIGRRSVGTNRIVVKDSTMTAENYESKMADVLVTYELATPIELPLTPQTVALLAGNNTLWTDGDSVTITYRR